MEPLRDEDTRVRFLSEVDSLRTVYGPFVAAFVRADADADQPWLAVEYVPAGVAKLSTGTDRVFDAMTSCPEYRVLAGSNAINITAQRMAPPQLCDEQWSQLLTFSADGRESIVKQTAICSGNGAGALRLSRPRRPPP